MTRMVFRLFFWMLTLLAPLVYSCEEPGGKEVSTLKADSLISVAYKHRDYQQLLTLTGQLQASGELSELKAQYWRGYAYSRQRKMRLAENCWKRALSLEIRTGEDLMFYSQSASRLSSLLLLKGEYEQTMKIAVRAMQVMTDAANDHVSDYAYLQTAIGCCQLHMGNLQEANQSFDKAYQIYQELIVEDPSTPNFNSAIASVITVTDNYLMLRYFKEAYAWTAHFDELLSQYQQKLAPDRQFLDKQQARLNLYKACSLEGLGQHKSGADAYQEALKTDYAKTSEGKLEATNYLMAAGRWDEASDNYEVLDNQIRMYGVALSMETIQRHLLPKYRANLQAHRIESAVKVGQQICDSLETAIMAMKKDETAELSAIYNMQQKETEIERERGNLARQRSIVILIVFALVTLFLVLFIYVRYQASLRLQAAYDKLAIANERAAESSHMKTSFIQQISHEIRTPLNILSGFTQVITAPDITLDEASKKDINEKIVENTNRITQLVNKMLELSDVNSTTVIECNDQVLAIQVAAQAMSSFAETGEGLAPISLEVDDAAGNLMIQTNEHAIVRVLELLLDNARRFTKEGFIRLQVGLQEGKACFTVEDTGIGVPADEAEHIFEEFVQLNEYEEGTGIGLTVARSLARRLGGDVVLDTSYTDGARFVLTHPVLSGV